MFDEINECIAMLDELGNVDLVNKEALANAACMMVRLDETGVCQETIRTIESALGESILDDYHPINSFTKAPSDVNLEFTHESWKIVGAIVVAILAILAAGILLRKLLNNESSEREAKMIEDSLARAIKALEKEDPDFVKTLKGKSQQEQITILSKRAEQHYAENPNHEVPENVDKIINQKMSTDGAEFTSYVTSTLREYVLDVSVPMATLKDVNAIPALTKTIVDELKGGYDRVLKGEPVDIDPMMTTRALLSGGVSFEVETGVSLKQSIRTSIGDLGQRLNVLPSKYEMHASAFIQESVDNGLLQLSDYDKAFTVKEMDALDQSFRKVGKQVGSIKKGMTSRIDSQSKDLKRMVDDLKKVKGDQDALNSITTLIDAADKKIALTFTTCAAYMANINMIRYVHTNRTVKHLELVNAFIKTMREYKTNH